jgi:hypothetical protein
MERFCIGINDYLLLQYNYEVIVIIFINNFLQFNVYNLSFISLPMEREL